MVGAWVLCIYLGRQVGFTLGSMAMHHLWPSPSVCHTSALPGFTLGEHATVSLGWRVMRECVHAPPTAYSDWLPYLFLSSQLEFPMGDAWWCGKKVQITVKRAVSPTPSPSWKKENKTDTK